MPTPPPLVWLRAFEAAARLGSFRAAASELSVTPSTISHQVRDLESRLGVPLFMRSGRGLALTMEGATYASSLRAGFELIKSAEIPDREDTRLRIGAFPFVINEVLVPNLPNLHDALPGVNLSLHSETHLHALSAPDPKVRVDAMIRYGTGAFPGCVSMKIADVFIAPVVANNILRIRRPEDVLDLPVIRVKGPFKGWEVWAKAMNLADTPQNVVLETDSYYAAMLAVEKGIGTCLGILPFVRPWVSSQRITILGDFTSPVEEESYLVYGPYREHDPNIMILHEWLVDALGSKVCE